MMYGARPALFCGAVTVRFFFSSIRSVSATSLAQLGVSANSSSAKPLGGALVRDPETEARAAGSGGQMIRLWLRCDALRRIPASEEGCALLKTSSARK